MIAILGATGYVGSSLARVLASRGHEPLALFTRRPIALGADFWPDNVSIRALGAFQASEFELVINAIGAGSPTRVAEFGGEILNITRTWDGHVLSTMSAGTRYVFLSSGAIYGGEFSEPVDEDSRVSVPVNRLGSVPAYTLAKLEAEARHRFLPQRAILDVRIFGYADIAIPLESRFFLSDLARSIACNEVFVTSPDPMMRDYAGALELAAVIDCWQLADAPNLAVDLYTQSPVSKHELLELAATRFGVQIQFARTADSPTGSKAVFASSFRKAVSLGYRPWRHSLEIVLPVLEAAAGRARGGHGK
ncbi:nucleoside-diphosphate-sugar epimerase [Bradyrhizobium sp. i1.8.4]|uniref:NAD-dependent epimerase/dehydratase family protein n=1 Tax=unclassified Bradyrhizobium TaxID=2631580 RepID=UPI003D23147D